MKSNSQKPLVKPLYRGYTHLYAFVTSFIACGFLLYKSEGSIQLITSLVYSLGLLSMFGVSALYHIPHWPEAKRKVLKRFDHCAIFIQIAGTFTPVCLLALDSQGGPKLLVIVWATALLGILQTFLWISAPKWLKALLYVFLGWFALPYLGELKNSMGTFNLILLAAGGFAYTFGAILYALKWPRLWPSHFGYHEVFHLLTILGAALHFAVVYQILRP